MRIYKLNKKTFLLSFFIFSFGTFLFAFFLFSFSGSCVGAGNFFQCWKAACFDFSGSAVKPCEIWTFPKFVSKFPAFRPCVLSPAFWIVKVQRNRLIISGSLFPSGREIINKTTCFCVWNNIYIYFGIMSNSVLNLLETL